MPFKIFSSYLNPPALSYIHILVQKYLAYKEGTNFCFQGNHCMRFCSLFLPKLTKSAASSSPMEKILAMTVRKGNKRSRESRARRPASCAEWTGFQWLRAQKAAKEETHTYASERENKEATQKAVRLRRCCLSELNRNLRRFGLLPRPRPPRASMHVCKQTNKHLTATTISYRRACVKP